MNIETKDNAATISLSEKESFFFKGTILTGFPQYDYCLLPPFPLGSPIMRLFYRSYFGMKRVTATSGNFQVPVTGYFDRGNFEQVEVPAGRDFFVNARCLVGFSGNIPRIHTHIKIHPVFWCLREHFFTVLRGPRKVLLYGRSKFEWRDDTAFEAGRIMAFDIERRLTTTIPQTTTTYSMFRNVFSSVIFWRFVDGGQTLVEKHHNVDSQEKFSLKHILLHVLAFLKV
jgi:hypothetical protein